MKLTLWILTVALLTALPSACVNETEGTALPEERVGITAQSLSSDPRTRVVQEASYAMTGNYDAYTSASWPTGTTLAGYYYSGTDVGAWNALVASPSYGPDGWYVSCVRYKTQGVLYNPCQLFNQSLSNFGFGSHDMPYYTCQGSCPSSRMHGGQCKPFMNLVAYRSGQYQGPSFAFKPFPSDSAISTWSTAADQMPFATYANILPGDFLRLPNGHATIVVRKISSSAVIVFDSNWVGNGDGDEVVGSHTLGFSGSGNSNLGNYRVLKCAYTGGC